MPINVSTTYENYVFTAELQDKISAPADQASIALDQMGLSAKEASAVVTSATSAMTAGFEKLQLSGRAGASAFSQLQRSIDPLGAQITRATAELDKLNRKFAEGKVTQSEYNSLLPVATARVADLTQRHEAYTRTAGQATTQNRALGFAMRDLSSQTIDLFQGLATGQPIFRTLIQQGSQIVQVNQAMGVSFREMAASIAGRLLSPLNLAIAGLAALGAAFVAAGVHTESLDRQLNTIGNSLRATRADWPALAEDVVAAGRAVSHAMDTTRADATAAIQAIASSPGWGGTRSQLEDLGKVATQMSLVLGGTAAENAKLLAKALTEPGEVAKILADRHLPGMTASIEHSIQMMDKAGQSAEAFAKLLDTVKDATAGAENNTTEIQKAIKELDQTFQDVTGSASTFGEAIGHAFQTAAATAIQMVAEMIKAIGDLGAAAKKYVPSNLGGGGLPMVDEYGRVLPGGTMPGTSASGAAGAALGGENYRAGSDLFGPPEVFGPSLPSASSIASGARYQQTLRQAYNTPGPKKDIEDITAALSNMRAQKKLATDPAEVKAFDNAIFDLTKKLDAAKKATQDHTKATVEHRDAAQSLIEKTRLQADQNNAVADAILRQDGSVNQLIASYKAQEQATGLTFKNDQQKIEFIQKQTEENLRLADSENRKQTDQQIVANRNATEVLNLQTESIGKNADETERSVEALKVRQDLVSKSIPLESDRAKAILESTNVMVQARQTNREAEASFNELTGFVDRTFDQIGNAIVDAFVQGSGAAVNFGNIAKAVVASLVQEFIKLALINPLKSAFTGEVLPTLGSVGTAGGGWLLPALGFAGQGGGGLGGIGNTLGFGNIFSGNNLFGGTGPVAGFLGQGLFGTSAAEAAASSGQLGSALTFGALPVPVGSSLGLTGGPTGLLGGASIGSLLGGGALGVGIGSLAGGVLQRALGKTGPGPMIGGGLGGLAGGAIAGAAAGSVVPIVGTIIGAIAGGLLGGALGPKPPSPYAATYVSIENGQLRAIPGLSGNQLAPSNVQMAQNQAAEFNQQMSRLGVQIAGTFNAPPAGAAGGLGFFGQAKDPRGIVGVNIADAISNVRFGAASNLAPQTVEVLNRALQRSFSSFEELGAEVNKVRTFVEQTVPALRRYGDTIGTLDQAFQAVDAAFNPAIQTARELGYAEEELTAKREQARDKAAQLALEPFLTMQGDLAARYAAATATTPEQQVQAGLMAFDQQANAQRKQLNDQLRATYGDAYQELGLYADLSVQLEKTLGAERLAAQKQANDAIAQSMDQAAQTAAQIISSISEYARGLQSSAASPLSPQAQLDLAQRQFQAVSGAALAGDANSLSKLTSYSDALLNAGRSVYGSGQGYAAIFQQVVDTLNAVGAISPDTLTASVFAVETRTQTASLVAAIHELQAEVGALRAQVASNGAMPGRLAA